MAFSQSDLDTLNAAIAGASLEVTFADGRRVRYRDMAELIQARRLIEGELSTEQAAPRLIPRYRRATFGD